MVKVHFGLTHKKVDSVLIIQFFNAGIIWVHNSKPRWELTGGKLEPGETIVQAAVRESYEESGAVVQASAIVPLGYYVLPTGHTTAVVSAKVERLQAIPASSEIDDRQVWFKPVPDAERSFHDDIYAQIFQHIGWPDE